MKKEKCYECGETIRPIDSRVEVQSLKTDTLYKDSVIRSRSFCFHNECYDIAMKKLYRPYGLYRKTTIKEAINSVTLELNEEKEKNERKERENRFLTKKLEKLNIEAESMRRMLKH